MKKQLLVLTALFFANTGYASLQVTNITLNPAPMAPTTNTTTVSVTVVGGTAPYTFTSSPVVTPTVVGNTASFTFPVVVNDTASITITDSSTPALTTTFAVSVSPQLFTSASFSFVAPCVKATNGRINISVVGATPTDYVLNGVETPSTATSFLYTGLATGTYSVAVLSGTTAVTVLSVPLNPFNTSFITDLPSYINYVYCQGCIARTVTPSGSVATSCNNTCGSCR